MNVDPNAVVAVLKEFIADVEAAGFDATEEDWPDLFVTYQKAKQLLGVK